MANCVLVPITIERDAYAGFVETHDGDFYRIALRCAPGAGRVDPTSVSCDPAFQGLLNPFLRSLAARSSYARDLDAFVRELTDLTDQAARSFGSSSDFPVSGGGGGGREGGVEVVPASFYEMLLVELHALGLHRLVDVDASKRLLVLSAVDGGGRCHELSLSLPRDYPHSPPLCTTDLPAPFVPRPAGLHSHGLPSSPAVSTSSASFPTSSSFSSPPFSFSSSSSSSAAASPYPSHHPVDASAAASAASAAAKFKLSAVVGQWEHALACYQDLWTHLDDLDDNTWILEPERVRRSTHNAGSSSSSSSTMSSTNTVVAEAAGGEGRPPRHALHRRVALAPHASFLFTLDPSRPHLPPAQGLRFMGKEEVVAPLRRRYSVTSSSSSSSWDSSGATTLRRNLEACLGIALPCPQKKTAAASGKRHKGQQQGSGGNGNEDKDDDGDDRHGFQAECAICYTYRLPATHGSSSSSNSTPSSSAATPASLQPPPQHATPTATAAATAAASSTTIPDVLCRNEKCNRSYHRPCLSEWLRGLPTASRSFDTVFGHCPYCFGPISVCIR